MKALYLSCAALILAGCAQQAPPPVAVAPAVPRRIAVSPSPTPTITYPPVQIGPPPGSTVNIAPHNTRPFTRANPLDRPDVQYVRHLVGLVATFPVLQSRLERAVHTMTDADIGIAESEIETYRSFAATGPAAPPRFTRIDSDLKKIGDELSNVVDFLKTARSTPEGFRGAAKQAARAADTMERLSVECRQIAKEYGEMR